MIGEVRSSQFGWLELYGKNEEVRGGMRVSMSLPDCTLLFRAIYTKRLFAEVLTAVG